MKTLKNTLLSAIIAATGGVANITTAIATEVAYSGGSLELRIRDACYDGFDSEYVIYGYTTSQPSPSTKVGRSPESGRVWIAKDNGDSVVTRHSCQTDAGHIVRSWCYGAKKRNGRNNWYGVGIRGNQGCFDCCTACPATGTSQRGIALGC